MHALRSLRAGLATLLNRKRAEQDLGDEIDHYFEQAVADRVRNGESVNEARRSVQMEIGNRMAVRETVRTFGWEHWVDTFIADTRYATRRLLHTPAFTAVAVLSLALGIGANTAIFSLVNATLIKRLPVNHPEQLAYVSGGSGAFSYPDFAELRANGTLFDGGLAAWGGITGSLSTNNTSNLVVGVIVTGNFFNVLGVNAQLGRTISESDDITPGAHPVVVISDKLWRTRFAARTGVVGSTVRFNGQPFTIIGVTPPAFNGPVLGETRDIYVPMMMQAIARPPRARYSGDMNPDLLGVRINRWLSGIGRLKPGATAEQAEAQLTAIAKDQEKLSPSEGTRVPVGSVTMVNEGRGERASLISVSRLLLAVVGVVLLIACVNVANLTLAQNSARRKEVAVRLALGATRGRLVRQLLTESVLLSTVGAAIGWGLAWGAVRMMRSAPPPDGALPITLDFAMDFRVLLFTMALAVLTGVLFGLVPAVRSTRPQLVPALKDQGSNNQRARALSGRNGLVVLQLALSLVLLITGGLFLRSLQISQSIDPGFDASRVATSAIRINILRYTRQQGRDMYRQAVERIEALPGVQSASLARNVPLTTSNSIRSLLIQGRDGPSEVFRREADDPRNVNQNTINVNTIGSRWFETMGVRLVKGRDFTARDDSGTTPVAIVNEAFVNTHLGTKEPIGQRISFGGPEGPWWEIVGVTETFKVVSLTETPQPLAFVPLLQSHETGMTLFVRSNTGSITTIAPSIQNALQTLEPNLPLSSVSSMGDLVNTSLYTARSGARMIIAFGAMALLLAAIGLYGVISYAVSRRTKELGLRMALGAHPRAVLRQIIGEAATLAAFGIATGIAVAFGVTRLLRTFLYGVSTSDTLTFAVISLVLMTVAVGASIVPARRAMRIDPIRALRTE